MKNRKTLTSGIAAVVLIMTGALIWLAFPPGKKLKANPGFNKGDVFCATGNGQVKRFNPATGTQILPTLDTGSGSLETAGMAFDCDGNLLSTQFQANSVFKFNIEGVLIGPFGSGYNANPESIVLDGMENVYIGQAGGTNTIRKYTASGTFLGTISPPVGPRGTDWLDIAGDQTTLFYTSEGKDVRRFNLSTNTAMTNFNTAALPGSNAFALRILRDGSVLVADTEVIVRLNSAGAVIKTYDAPGEDYWFALNLDPDGKTFWSGHNTTGQVYRFNIDGPSGEPPVFTFDAGTRIAGLAVFGEITIATGADLEVTKMDAPDPVLTCGDLTYTIKLTDKGPCPARSMELNDAVPPNTTFRSMTPPAGWTCTTPAVGGTGNVNCKKATPLGDGEMATFTLVVRVNPNVPDGTMIDNAVNVTSITPDPNPSNNGAKATTMVAPNPPPTITCPANITRPTDPGLCTAAVTFAPTVTDSNCPGVTFVCAPASGFAFPKGTTTVNCTATDSGGKTASCSFTVTVADTEPPKPICPANITQSTDPGVCDAVVKFTAVVTDNCPGATIVCAPLSGSTFPKGVTTVTCKAVDAASNMASCSFTVTVVDTEKPKIACPVDIFTTTGNGPVVVSYPNPAVSDNCPGVTFVCVPPKSSAFPIGVTTVICTATDTSSNQSSCSFKVTVEAVKCDTICFRPPGYFLADLSRVPRGAVLVGGANYNNDTNTRDLEEIRLALKGNALGYGTLTPLQQLNKEFVAAQLSFILAGGDGSPVNYNVMWSRLLCFGLNLESVTLTNGVTLTRDSMLKELFMAARSAIVENRTADMVTLAGLFNLLNGNDALGRCGPLRPIADLVPIAPNGFTGFCAFSGGTLRVTIKNQGDAASVASKTDVSFGSLTITVATPLLLPNESVDLDIAVPVGGSPPVTLTITADSGNQVAERSRANNSITIKCP